MASLRATFPEKCIGCELCVMEVQKQLERAGLEGSLIRILRRMEGDSIVYTIDIDPQVNYLDIERVKNICPTAVFSIEDSETPHDF